MRILFYIVHPARFFLHRYTINQLINKKHDVDIIINSKDILEGLVIEEGWPYTNLFPKGRKIESLPNYISAGLILPINIARLFRYIKQKNYDLLVGSITGLVGKPLGIPTLHFTDDDIYTTPTQALPFTFSDYIVAPKLCDLGKFNSKKISYDSQKGFAHLHPKYFKPQIKKIPKSLRTNKPYFLIRLSKYNSIHDSGSRSGIDDQTLTMIVKRLIRKGDVVISSERTIPKHLTKFQLDFPKKNMPDLLYYSSLLIADSTTMIAEASILGIPSIEYDDWWEEKELLRDLQARNLSYGIKTGDIDELKNRIEQIINKSNFDMETFRSNHKKFIEDCIDISSLQLWLIENYPKSAELIIKNPNYQYKYRFKES